MEKRQSWQLYLILAVLAFTLYSIAPSIIFYARPLKERVGPERAEQVATGIAARVDHLKEQAVGWLWSFAKLQRVKPTSITVSEEDPGTIEVRFSDEKEANRFASVLPRAGASISFVPAQLQLRGVERVNNESVVSVGRRIPVYLGGKDSPGEYFSYFRREEEGIPSPFYQQIVLDRVEGITKALQTASSRGVAIAELADQQADPAIVDREVLELAQWLDLVDRAYERDYPALAGRIYQSMSLVSPPHQVTLSPDVYKKWFSAALQRLESATGEGVGRQKVLLEKALELVSQHAQSFWGVVPEGIDTKAALLAPGEELQRKRVPLGNTSPFFRELAVDYKDGRFSFEPYEDVEEILSSAATTEVGAFQRDVADKLLVGQIAHLGQHTEEVPSVEGARVTIQMDRLPDTYAFLALSLDRVAAERIHALQRTIGEQWHPSHRDLRDLPVLTWKEYRALPARETKYALVLYSPLLNEEGGVLGELDSSSLYILARGLSEIARHANATAGEEESQLLIQDLQGLRKLLSGEGFTLYSSSPLTVGEGFRDDLLFGQTGFYDYLLKATREDFQVRGKQHYALLDLTDVEQRILTLNRIEDAEQEELLKWRDDYEAAQVSLDPVSRYFIPQPTRNPYWENLKLSARKYFRGDDGKVLRWGLDLSGGKTVRIGLVDQQGQVVTNPDELNQVVNELYTRVNELGVAERTIRVENHNIILDFPGAQGLSAEELVRASSMRFRIVNERFGLGNPELAESVNAFLQSVWDEAVVTNRADVEGVNQIARSHLGQAEGQIAIRSAVAQRLVDEGLWLADSNDAAPSSAFDDRLSVVTLLRGEGRKEWWGQSHPLLITFYNYALEGSNLSDVTVGYDPAKGNILHFGVRKRGSGVGESGSNPQEDFYQWTSQFAKARITGTPREALSGGLGWRMAVELNNRVISAPALEDALNDRATITGRFSQREVNQLAADLKAGALSFTPKIFSEQNVSPELGKEERSRGLMASLVALSLVVVTMVGYYRLAGVVASIAVLLNIVIIWGVLQNLGAALTLPGIAGIVLTIGMAVDANVLVFERIREEFALSGRIASAIATGYRKAFSAIFDSNITTILAAFILIQFDAGPIKGFAVVLIIGIISSMFTALFLTRYFFAGWVHRNPGAKLNMANWIGTHNFEFLNWGRYLAIFSLAIALAGGVTLYTQPGSILGMDFTGGYSLTLEMAKTEGVENYRLAVRDALERAGAAPRNVQVQQLSRPTQLRVQLGQGIEAPDQPLYNPSVVTEGEIKYGYQAEPKLNWVVEALDSAGLQIDADELVRLQDNWSVMSGQFSDTMRNNALMALGCALLAILAYITVRFEFKYAISAVIALAHDVIVTLAILVLFYAAGFPVQIDLEVIGAIMTIIGYSLNDTIIVFDRIREDLRLYKKMSFSEVINHALNATLSRTVLTSLTTVLVLLALVLLGGDAIFGFSLVMTVGVLIGTFSSLFIAPRVLLFFHKREEAGAEETRGRGSLLREAS